ncbi:MAG: hypothetical protein UY78_C0008G0001, partial [Parcubacteria group bacterium GW2011_GWA1_53_13]
AGFRSTVKPAGLDRNREKSWACPWSFIFSVIGIVGLSLVMSGAVFAQGMMTGVTTTDDHTAREEAEGKIVWEKLQAKEISCTDVSDENFGTLGEYFMGVMMGDSHASMNAMMIQMHGEEWEEQTHIVMGKRFSGCDASAAFPGGSDGGMPMTYMMTGGWSSPFGFNQMYDNSMMNFGFTPFGWFGWIFMIMWWALIIAGIVALIKWLAGQSRRGRDNEKSPLDILKERYAKGEIDKKEFEEKKKDLIG